MMRQRFEVRHLSLLPRRFRVLLRVTAISDNRRHPRPERVCDLLVGGHLVFERVVEQPRDRLVLVASGLEYKGTSSKQMTYIRNLGPFPKLLTVPFGGKRQSPDEPVGEISHDSI